jgi:hypothetical protein
MHPRFVRGGLDLARVVEMGKTVESLSLEFKSAVDGWRVPMNGCLADRTGEHRGVAP